MLERDGQIIEFKSSDVLDFDPITKTAVEQLIIGSQPHDDFMRVDFMTPQSLMYFNREAEGADDRIQNVIRDRRRQGAIASNAAAFDLLGIDFIEGAVLYSLPEIDPHELETLHLPRVCGLYVPIDSDTGNITVDEREMLEYGLCDFAGHEYMMKRLISWVNAPVLMQ